MTPNACPYKVDGEVGQFKFTTHSVSHGDEIQYNTGRDLFAELKGKELYRTIGFKEIAMIYGDTEESYRKTTSLINRIRYQAEGGTPYRTLQENTEQEGRKLIEYVERTSKCILQQNGFSEDGVYLGHKVPDAENQGVRLSNYSAQLNSPASAMINSAIHPHYFAKRKSDIPLPRRGN